jgi:hypothetical protein
VQNANTAKVLKAMRDDLEAFIDNLMDDPPAPAVKLPPKQKWEWHLDHIARAFYLLADVGPEGLAGIDPVGGTWAGYQASPMLYDLAGITQELTLLMRDDYVQGFKAGVYPPLVSVPFRNYLNPQTRTGLLLGLEAWRKRFAKLHAAYNAPEAPQPVREPVAEPEAPLAPAEGGY